MRRPCRSRPRKGPTVREAVSKAARKEVCRAVSKARKAAKHRVLRARVVQQLRQAHDHVVQPAAELLAASEALVGRRRDGVRAVRSVDKGTDVVKLATNVLELRAECVPATVRPTEGATHRRCEAPMAKILQRCGHAPA